MKARLIPILAYMFLFAGIPLSFAQGPAVHEGGGRPAGCYNSAGQWGPCRNDQTNSEGAAAAKRERERVRREEKMQRDYEEKAQRQRVPERSPAQADAGWECFPDYANCTKFCRESLGAEGNAGWCGGICSPSGTGRMPKPAKYGNQRCYHAP